MLGRVRGRVEGTRGAPFTAGSVAAYSTARSASRLGVAAVRLALSLAHAPGGRPSRLRTDRTRETPDDHARNARCIAGTSHGGCCGKVPRLDVPRERAVVQWSGGCNERAAGGGSQAGVRAAVCRQSFSRLWAAKV